MNSTTAGHPVSLLKYWNMLQFFLYWKRIVCTYSICSSSIRILFVIFINHKKPRARSNNEFYIHKSQTQSNWFYNESFWYARKALTSSTFFGTIGGTMLWSSKKTKSAFETAVTKLAIILLVLIATPIEGDLSPITATGASRLNLKQVE